MEELRQWIPFLLPIFLIQVTLMVFALVDLVRREHTKGPKWMWALIVIFINIIGPVVYLFVGREE
jgi:uncharacterized membrane protein YhaH (DUF805 family)